MRSFDKEIGYFLNRGDCGIVYHAMYIHFPRTKLVTLSPCYLPRMQPRSCWGSSSAFSTRWIFQSKEEKKNEKERET